MKTRSVPKGQRLRPREAVKLPARVFPSGEACTILDLTTRGMRLALLEPERISPDTFVLVEWDSGEAHEARAVWFKAAEVGIEILRSCDLRDRVPDMFAEAKTAWLLTPQAQGAGL